MKHKLLVFGLALSLAACANAGGGVSSKVAAAEQSLTTLERLALIYTQLPRCGPRAPSICSDQSAVDRIKTLDNNAYVAVRAARGNEALLSNAIAAISAFQNAIPKTGG